MCAKQYTHGEIRVEKYLTTMLDLYVTIKQRRKIVKKEWMQNGLLSWTFFTCMEKLGFITKSGRQTPVWLKGVPTRGDAVAVCNLMEKTSAESRAKTQDNKKTAPPPAKTAQAALPTPAPAPTLTELLNEVSSLKALVKQIGLVQAQHGGSVNVTMAHVMRICEELGIKVTWEDIKQNAAKE